MEPSSIGGEAKKKKRGKVKLARIEDKTSRQVRFSKRKGGLFKRHLNSLFSVMLRWRFSSSLLLAASLSSPLAPGAYYIADAISIVMSILVDRREYAVIGKTFKRYQQFMRSQKESTEGQPKVDDSNIKQDENTYSSSDFKSSLQEIAFWADHEDLEQLDASTLDQLEKLLLNALSMITSKKIAQREREELTNVASDQAYLLEEDKR